MNALSFALIAVTIGGWMVDLPTPLLHLFGIGGCVFWPVYAVIAQRWMKTGRRWLLLLLLAWCAQGFFRIVFRFWGLMSV